jgi:hypothetical protein
MSKHQDLDRNAASNAFGRYKSVIRSEPRLTKTKTRVVPVVHVVPWIDTKRSECHN